MAMTIKNNTALLSLNALNKNTLKLEKDLKKVASGHRVPTAASAPSEWSIGAKMRVQIRALEQDTKNAQNGISLLKVAAGGINNIIEELRTLKEIAINAANDTNTDTDREILQKTFDAGKINIEDIVTSTIYNEKRLLDGTFDKRARYLSSEYVTADNATSGSSSQTGEVNYPKPYTKISAGVSEPTGIASYTVSGNTITITSDGIYSLSVSDEGKNIVFGAGVKNVKFAQSDSSVMLKNIAITASQDGGSNLWLENVNIVHNDSMSEKNFVKFNGGNNVLNLKGNNNLTLGISERAVKNKAFINAGGGLTVEGGADGTGELKADGDMSSTAWGAVIGADSREDIRNTNITVNSGTFKSSLIMRNGALIGSGYNSLSHIGNITINGGTFIDCYDKRMFSSIVMDYDVACMIGSGHSSSSGEITIKNAILKANLPNKFSPLIGHDASNSNQGDTTSGITLDNCYVYYRGGRAAGIGSGWHGYMQGNIMISNSYLDIQSDTGAGVGSSERSMVGDITIINSDIKNVKSSRGEDIGKGLDGHRGEVKIIGEGSGKDAGDSASESESDTEGITATGNRKDYVVTGKSLTIHQGTKANQAVNIFIGNMHTYAMNCKIENANGEVKTKNIDDARVTTRNYAGECLSIVDAALDYALDEATNVGAYISRLEFTRDNLITASENTQAGESVTSDADLAKEMTNFVKDNILVQVSQSMLAQANQNEGNVLNLLQ